MEDSMQYSSDVVWLASFPKSGATWTQSVVIRAGRSYGCPQIDLDVYKLLREKKSPIFCKAINPDITDRQCTILKTHNLWLGEDILHKELNLKTVGFLHIIRNPLDMLLSYLNFTKIQYQNNPKNENFQRRLFIDLLGYDSPIDCEKWVQVKLEDIPIYNLDHALDYFIETEMDIPTLKFVGGGWLEHNLSWNNASKKYPSAFLKYEDCIENPDTFLQLEKIFKFSTDDIRSAVDTVNNLVKNHKNSDDPKIRIFYNKMKSYYYVNFFSKKLIIKFLDRYVSQLKFFGYNDLPY